MGHKLGPCIRYTVVVSENGQLQKISIPNHGRLPCFNPPAPLPSEIPKCVSPPSPMPLEFHNREPALPFRISGFFLEVHVYPV